MRLGALLAVLLLLWAAASAAAHGDGGDRGFVSRVTSVGPEAGGVEVEVLEHDDRLVLRNRSGKEVVVVGYDGEPYLRFTADGVLENDRSPATYLNQDRYARVQPPEGFADADAAPAWRRVADGDEYEWHDHRIHWMSEIAPPQVRRAPDDPHHVFDWTIPARVDGRRVTISGTLDYRPVGAASTWTSPVVLGGGAALLVAAAGLGLVARRRRAGARAG